MKLYNWKVGTYLQLQRWVSLCFQKWWSALITSKYVYWIAFDGRIHATLVTRFDYIIKRFLWNVTTFQLKKLNNISDHETLELESWYILTVTKMSITSLSKVMECLDNVKICLLNRFWWRDSCNACHKIWQHHKTIFMATFQKSFIGPIHVIALFPLFSFAATHTMHKCKQTLFKCVFL